MALLLYDKNGAPKNDAAIKLCKAWGVKTRDELKAREARVMGRVRAKKESRNCGDGAGGFKPGNVCAKGGDGEPSEKQDRPEGGYTAKITTAIDKEMTARGLDPKDSYTRARGLLELPPESVVKSIASEQQSQTGKPLSPEAKKSYDAFKAELLDQYSALVADGLRPIPFTGKGEPYNAGPDKLWTPSSEAMRQAVEKTGEFYFFQTKTGFGGDGSTATKDHPLLEMSPAKDAKGNQMLWNDVFRVVHDNVAHIRGGFGFNTRGEMNGMIAHASTLTLAARPALFAETFAQNSVYETTKGFATQNAYFPSKVSMAVLDGLIAQSKKLSGTNERAMPSEDMDEDTPTGPGRLRRQPHGDDSSEATETKPDDEAGESRNCGDGAGGFKEKNTCAKGGDDELLRSAIVRWKGNPSDLVIHMNDAVAGKPAPSSGSGKKLRAMAEEILRAVGERGESAPTLYRGDNNHPSDISNPVLGWTENKKVAEQFAREYGGVVYTLEGASGLNLKNIVGDMFDDGEREWIVKNDEGTIRNHLREESRNCGTGKGGFQKGNKCAAGPKAGHPGASAETIDARGESAGHAADLLNEGHNVVVRAGDLDRLFRKMAAREDDPDITNLVIHGTTLFGGEGLGIARGDMPQFGDTQAEFLQHLRDQGITTQDAEISPLTLRPIQKEISGRRAGKKYIKAVKSGMGKLAGIVVSRDGYIIDGHHRWAAAVARASNKPSTKVAATVIGTDHDNALRISLDWVQMHGLAGKSMTARSLEPRNCGDGAGGFKPGNKCAIGGDGDEALDAGWRGRHKATLDAVRAKVIAIGEQSKKDEQAARKRYADAFAQINDKTDEQIAARDKWREEKTKLAEAVKGLDGISERIKQEAALGVVSMAALREGIDSLPPAAKALADNVVSAYEKQSALAQNLVDMGAKMSDMRNEILEPASKVNAAQYEAIKEAGKSLATKVISEAAYDAAQHELDISSGRFDWAVNEANKGQMMDATRFYRAVMAPNVSNRDVFASGHAAAVSDLDRAYASHADGGKGGDIFIPWKTSESTIIHEIGHLVEFNNPAVREAANAFVERRCGKSESMNMAETFAGFGYKEDEVGNSDNFLNAVKATAAEEDALDATRMNARAAYIGKRYKNGDTEVISMGMEMLKASPYKFAKADPEYFDLVVAAATGAINIK